MAVGGAAPRLKATPTPEPEEASWTHPPLATASSPPRAGAEAVAAVSPPTSGQRRKRKWWWAKLRLKETPSLERAPPPRSLVSCAARAGFGPRRDEEERREALSPSWGPSPRTVSLRGYLGGRFGRMEMDAQGLLAPGSALACQGLPHACKSLRGPTSRSCVERRLWRLEKGHGAS